MRDILVLGIVLASVPLAFRRPFLGLLVFSWLAYMRPQDLCWGFARDMRFSFYAAIAMLIGFFAHERGVRPFMRVDIRTLLMVALLLLTSISLMFAEKVDTWVVRSYVEFVKIFLIALFTTGQVDNKERIRLLLWTICISLGFYGVKGGIHGILSGGSPILRGPGGMLEDNNDFALGLVMNLPLLWYLGVIEKKRWVTWACRAATALSLISIMLTHSRGGFLAACGVLLMIAWRSRKLLRALFTMGLVVLLFFQFAPQHVLDRLATIKKGGQESSANARLISWQIASRMIKSNPVLGVGLRNYQVHWDRHLDGIVGARRGGFAYVAHNSYLQIWAEAGTPAFLIYVALLLSVFTAARRIRRAVRGREDLDWARIYANLFEAVMVGFMIGAVFLNRGHFDLIYHDLALVSCTYWIVARALQVRPVEAKGGAKVMTVRWQTGRQAAGRLPRWGRT